VHTHSCKWESVFCSNSSGEKHDVKIQFHNPFMVDTIPTEFALLTKLTFLEWISFSALSSTIPTNIWTLTNLKSLKLKSDYLGGVISHSMKHFSQSDPLNGTGQHLSILNKLHFLHVHAPKLKIFDISALTNIGRLHKFWWNITVIDLFSNIPPSQFRNA
jgi:hypothetical protein